MANKKSNKQKRDLTKAGCLLVLVIVIIAVTLHIASCVKEENHRVETIGFSLTTDSVDGKLQNVQKSFVAADERIYFTFNCIDVPAGTDISIDWFREGVEHAISHSEFTTQQDAVNSTISTNISQTKYDWSVDGGGKYSIRISGKLSEKELFVIEDSFEITE